MQAPFLFIFHSIQCTDKWSIIIRCNGFAKTNDQPLGIALFGTFKWIGVQGFDYVYVYICCWEILKIGTVLVQPLLIDNDRNVNWNSTASGIRFSDTIYKQIERKGSFNRMCFKSEIVKLTARVCNTNRKGFL